MLTGCVNIEAFAQEYEDEIIAAENGATIKLDKDYDTSREGQLVISQWER